MACLTELDSRSDWRPCFFLGIRLIKTQAAPCRGSRSSNDQRTETGCTLLYPDKVSINLSAPGIASARLRADETITLCFGAPIHPVWRAGSCFLRNRHFPHLTSMDGGNAVGVQEQSLPCGSGCENLNKLKGKPISRQRPPEGGKAGMLSIKDTEYYCISALPAGMH